MFHIYLVRRKDDKFIVRFVNSVVSSTGNKTSATLTESKIPMTANMAVSRGEELIDALLNAGLSVEPSLRLKDDGVE